MSIRPESQYRVAGYSCWASAGRAAALQAIRKTAAHAVRVRVVRICGKGLSDITVYRAGGVDGGVLPAGGVEGGVVGGGGVVGRPDCRSRRRSLARRIA